MQSNMKLHRDLPRRRRRRRLRSIAGLPTLMTLGNLVCGFAAIHFGLRAMFAAGAGLDASAAATLDSALVERMLPSFLAIGAGLIFAGMFFDMLDGVVARLANRVSTFGVQIDSLADVVTFGVAPAILLIALMMREWHGDEVLVTPLSEQAIGRAMWVSAAVYCMCAAVRLARFNVEQGRVEISHRRFRGLPSPGAAAMVASLITLYEHLHGDVAPALATGLLMSLPGVALIAGLLMISRIPYRRIDEGLTRRRPFEHLLGFVVLFVIFWSYKVQTIAFLCCLYAASGPVIWLVGRWRSSGGSDDEADMVNPADAAKQTA